MPENVPPLRVLCSACGHMGCEHQAEKMKELAERLQQLEVAARQVLAANEPGVPEGEGMRRCSALAKLVGYDAGPIPSTGMPASRTDFDAMQREMLRLAGIIGPEVENTSPGWCFSLLLYQDRPDPQNGHVLHIARDRERALPAVAKWVCESLEAQKTKASS